MTDLIANHLAIAFAIVVFVSVLVGAFVGMFTIALCQARSRQMPVQSDIAPGDLVDKKETL